MRHHNPFNMRKLRNNPQWVKRNQDMAIIVNKSQPITALVTPHHVHPLHIQKKKYILLLILHIVFLSRLTLEHLPVN